MDRVHLGLLLYNSSVSDGGSSLVDSYCQSWDRKLQISRSRVDENIMFTFSVGLLYVKL